MKFSLLQTAKNPKTLSLVLRVVFVAGVLFGLGACSGDLSDLDTFIAEEKTKPGARVPPLREVKPYEKYKYSAEELRSPFQPPVTEDRVAAARNDGLRPDLNRNREYLEQFPLDTMRMVGTLNSNNQLFALLQTDDGLIHRVQPGNYIGQNYGKVTSVSETDISLTEIVSDGVGGYIDRQAGLALSEE